MKEVENDFMAGVLAQLYQNRNNHEDSESRDVDYMFKIGAEQYGQLGKALADGNTARAVIEVFHVAAILFEIFARITIKGEKG
jgi:hypothetical protein